MARLWDKGAGLDPVIHQFTVGRDPELDLQLLPADCAASVAHAAVLERAGVLSAEEKGSLETALREIARRSLEGSFPIPPDLEDGHTAIENSLTQTLGEAGRKIHTGRSRNDQVLTCLRLYTRERVLDVAEAASALVAALLDLGTREERTLMPGRTHMQLAMPSSVGLWAAAWAEELLEHLELLDSVSRLVNRSPLGAAAGYGPPLTLDRAHAASLMGFARPVTTSLGAIQSRGITEARVLSVLDDMGLTLSRIASDLILFALPELGYFSLPTELCTGSSIMPQKQNPDLLELLRSGSARLSAAHTTVRNVIRSSPGGYNRDVQDTKAPLLEGFALTRQMLSVAARAVSGLRVNHQKIRSAMAPELFATDASMARVDAGESFREAYGAVATDLQSVSVPADEEVFRRRQTLGAPGNPGTGILQERLTAAWAVLKAARDHHAQAIRGLIGSQTLVPGEGQGPAPEAP